MINELDRVYLRLQQRVATEVMIVAFGTRAEIRAPFTDNIASLESAIDAIRPTDELTVLGEALELSRAFTSNLNVNDARGEKNEIPVGDLPTIELYSDGRIGDHQRAVRGPSSGSGEQAQKRCVETESGQPESEEPHREHLVLGEDETGPQS